MLSKPHPAHNAGQGDHTKKIVGELVVASGQGQKVLGLTKSIFNKMLGRVNISVIFDSLLFLGDMDMLSSISKSSPYY